MDFAFSPREKAFRLEVKDWLRNNLEDHVNRDGSSRDANIYREFALRLASKGWIAPHWPVAWGGLGLSIMEQVIFNEEMAYHEAPLGYVGFGAGWVGPTIISHGTDQQKQRFLPGIARGETIWCQGFSEANAGSDLANVETLAHRTSSGYVVNGSKLWTSGAHYADWMILLARTDVAAPKHKGISYFLVNMDSPGITVRPLQDMMNRHGFNEVHLENVSVPSENLLGDENRGWYMATTTLAFERSSIGGASRGRRLLDDLLGLTNDFSASRNQSFRLRLAESRLEVEIGTILSYRVAAVQSRGLVPNLEASIAKLFNTDLQLRLVRTGLKVAGLLGQLEPDSKWAPLKGRLERQYLWQTGMNVGGGTPEIQRNIVATRGLELPRR